MLALCAICVSGTGCVTDSGCPPCNDNQMPRELRMTSLPLYRVEPPDILLIDTLRVIPKPPYRIEPLDTLLINVTNTLPNEPISGLFGVDPEGAVNLGTSYGLVHVAGMTLGEAQAAIQTALAERVLRNPRVTVSLAYAHGMQQIRGEHLVRPDGTIGLGVYGSVYVSGLTLDEVRRVVEAQLGTSLLKPEVSVDVFAYNSKFYYVIADGAGYGQQIIRLPVTGKETVLDAVAQIGGLPLVSSKKSIWVARPNGKDPCDYQVLAVNWPELSMGGAPETNYQLMPGDRVYINANPLITVNNRLAQVLAPVERVLGITLLGATTVNAVTNATTKNNGALGNNAIVR
jgi:polysaccharide export outer membrane protein